MKLNLGCGRDLKDGWVNIDHIDAPGVFMYDLNRCDEQWLPYNENMVDEILASHVLEHIPNILPLMQELHRVAKPGAMMTVRVPYGGSDDAFEDPTHVRQYFLNSFGYYSQPFYWRADYGYRGDWKVKAITILVPKYMGVDKFGKPITQDKILARVMSQRNVAREMIVTLEAVKPIREPLQALQDRYHLEIQVM